MNTIITSNVVDPNIEQPWKSTSLQFLEDSQLETYKNVVISLIGSSYSTSIVYILFGCVRSGTADGGSGAVAVTAGAVFFNGEVYTVDAFAGTLVANNLGSAVIVTNGTPDPTVFSDNVSTFNVHNVRKWIPVVGGGSNLVNNWVNCGLNGSWNTFNLTAGGVITLLGGSGGTWTDGGSWMIYKKIGDTLHFEMYLTGTLSAAPNYIIVDLSSKFLRNAPGQTYFPTLNLASLTSYNRQYSYNGSTIFIGTLSGSALTTGSNVYSIAGTWSLG